MGPQTAQFSTHRNPKYWEDSEAFVPERFLDGKAASNPAFSPFGDVRLHDPSAIVQRGVHCEELSRPTETILLLFQSHSC